MRTVLLACVLLGALFVHARDFEVRLWPGGAPSATGLESAPEVNSDGRASKVSDPVIHVYPAARPGSPAIIMCPGGGYSHLAVNHEGHDMAQWMNRLGVTFIVLKYRMPNGHKEVPLADSRRAIEIVRDSASVWNADPRRVGVMGCSAGGHFAATLAVMYGDSLHRPDFQILLYPVISMEDGLTHRGSRDNLLGKDASPEDVGRYSLDRQVCADTPPAFIALSADDRAVPPANSLRYAQALIDHKVPVSLHMFPTGGHGWGFRDSFLYKREWTGELEAWLRNLSSK